VPRIAATRPHDDHHPPAQKSGRYDAGFAVVAAMVGLLIDGPGEHFDRIDEIHSSLAQRPLGVVESDPLRHLMYLHKIIDESNLRL
jgi:hypothetical protein